MPFDQRALIAAVERGKSAYEDGRNDLAKGASRPARAKDICQALRSLSASRWVGRVYELSSTSDGKGVLAVEIAEDVYVKTWNNALSDGSDKTLITPGSALMNKAMTLKEGQMVVFSGSFLRGKTDCFEEQSLSLSGSMTEPEFVFRFSDIGPAPF